MVKQEGDLSEQKGPIIELPVDPQTVEKLRRKLAEYKDRLEQFKKDNIHKHPELVLLETTDTRYKIAVLEKVIEGNGDAWTIGREIDKQDGNLDLLVFQNACGVIEDYCKTGGNKTIRSTGLK